MGPRGLNRQEETVFIERLLLLKGEEIQHLDGGNFLRSICVQGEQIPLGDNGAFKLGVYEVGIVGSERGANRCRSSWQIAVLSAGMMDRWPRNLWWRRRWWWWCRLVGSRVQPCEQQLPPGARGQPGRNGGTRLLPITFHHLECCQLWQRKRTGEELKVQEPRLQHGMGKACAWRARTLGGREAEVWLDHPRGPRGTESILSPPPPHTHTPSKCPVYS